MALYRRRIRGEALAGTAASDQFKSNTGLASNKDAGRMFARDIDLRLGNTDMIPDSLPDPEEFARQARRRMLSRRRGRMSTILTGGSLGSPDAALGG